MSLWRGERAEEREKITEKWVKCPSQLNTVKVWVAESLFFLSPAPLLIVFGCFKTSRMLLSSRRHLNAKKRTKHSWRPKVNTPSTTMMLLTIEDTEDKDPPSWTQFSFKTVFPNEKLRLFLPITRWRLLHCWFPVGNLWLGRSLSQVLGLEVSHCSGSSCCRMLRMTTQYVCSRFSECCCENFMWICVYVDYC